MSTNQRAQNFFGVYFQRTLKLITLTLRRLQRTVSIPIVDSRVETVTGELSQGAGLYLQGGIHDPQRCMLGPYKDMQTHFEHAAFTVNKRIHRNKA